MAGLINLDGRIYPADTPVLTASNRAFRYGDALFESIRRVDGRQPLLALHLDRIQRSAGQLFFKIPAQFDLPFWKNEIEKVAAPHPSGRIRITLFRQGEGLYTPTTDSTSYLIEFQKLTQKEFTWVKEGIHLGIYPDRLPLTAGLDNLKTANSLPYILAARYRQQAGFDDCLLINLSEKIVEASSSNIFVKTGSDIFTPPLTSGCLDGVMRRYLIRLMKQQGQSVVEQSVSISDLEQADEVFLTNAIQGIRWVSRFQNTTFESAFSKQLFQEFKERIDEKDIGSQPG